jgi:inward rectifier potassium channel
MTNPKSWRILKRDGSLNIAVKRINTANFFDLYHWLLRINWFEFLVLIILAYLCINFIFATIYWLCGAGALDGTAFNFWNCFFFSVQTFATIGYGKITPTGILPNIVVTFEAFIGLMSVALMTGLVFSRFSRPTAKVVFSDYALITPIEGIPCFVCRVGNKRLNQIVDAHLSAVLLRSEQTKEGERYRELYDLKLERDSTPIFSMSWTIIHPITPDSPLYGTDPNKLESSDAEILVSLSGRDETLSQEIHARFSYTAEDIRWNHRFVDIINRNEKGLIEVDFENIHQTRPTNLN